ncbi:hypothetical protein CONPUDRAFT_162807 [Coniophora puteana RWD-64-598 SS2]|uniref:Superoxide dismutase copper/zinc binding domain-containing protein n=1 Tax=Coniophora puteana (strain RWD-64-598) TaxID=741705 RepID=A0A5M3N408_CONPW|nr:uncharacterized protein CONPUDRAFT_162807 [Coniophora puteana RWD-64-598 SS2]EIW85651.1 hypothetical protein CONPUDRAFT_162807 [Coniophora puteana RWD-64-598 SS2]
MVQLLNPASLVLGVSLSFLPWAFALPAVPTRSDTLAKRTVPDSLLGHAYHIHEHSAPHARDGTGSSTGRGATPPSRPVLLGWGRGSEPLLLRSRDTSRGSEDHDASPAASSTHHGLAGEHKHAPATQPKSEPQSESRDGDKDRDQSGDGDRGRGPNISRRGRSISNASGRDRARVREALMAKQAAATSARGRSRLGHHDMLR